MHTVVVDWSGDREGDEHKIWLAEVRDGDLVRLESGRGREQVVEHLAAEADRDFELVVGLDFAFSFPVWFLNRRHFATGSDVWSLVDEKAERWLDRCDRPFWGKPGATKPKLPSEQRQSTVSIPYNGPMTADV